MNCSCSIGRQNCSRGKERTEKERLRWGGVCVRRPAGSLVMKYWWRWLWFCNRYFWSRSVVAEETPSPRRFFLRCIAGLFAFEKCHPPSTSFDQMCRLWRRTYRDQWCVYTGRRILKVYNSICCSGRWMSASDGALQLVSCWLLFTTAAAAAVQ